MKWNYLWIKFTFFDISTLKYSFLQINYWWNLIIIIFYYNLILKIYNYYKNFNNYIIIINYIIIKWNNLQKNISTCLFKNKINI